MKKLVTLVLALCMLLSVCVAAQAASYPSAPITIIVCRSAGGSADIVARQFAPYLGKELNTNVVVENVDGGSGSIGLTQAWRATPDGYTLVWGNFPSYVLSEVVDGDKDYVMREFQPIVGVSGNEGNVLIVPGDSQFNTVEELVAYATENPGKLNMAVTSGVSNSALAQAMFLSETGVDVVSIPYDSGNKCATAVIGKEVDVAVCSGSAIYNAAADKTVRVLATFGPKEDEALPGVPTFASIYGEEFAYDVVMGLLAPKDTPADVLTALREAGLKAATSEELKAEANSFNVVPRNAEELALVIEGAYTLGDATKDLLGQ